MESLEKNIGAPEPSPVGVDSKNSPVSFGTISAEDVSDSTH